MATVVMYSSATCPYCDRAAELLERKKVAFETLRIDLDPALRDEMIAKTGKRSVPQIFINGQPIGGCDDLYALDSRGELDKLLAQ